MLFFPIPTSLKKRSLVRSFVCLFGSAFIFSLCLSLFLSLLSFPFLLWVDLWHPRVPRDVCHKLQSNLVTMLAFFPCLFMTFFFFHFFLLFLFFPSRSGAPDVKQPRYGSFRFPFFCLVRKQMCVSLSPPSYCLSPSHLTVPLSEDLWPVTSDPPDAGNALLSRSRWVVMMQCLCSECADSVLRSFSLFGTGLVLDGAQWCFLMFIELICFNNVIVLSSLSLVATLMSEKRYSLKVGVVWFPMFIKIWKSLGSEGHEGEWAMTEWWCLTV